MKRHGDETDPAAWFDLARTEFERARRSMDDQDTELALVMLQQAAEKAMKGRLIALGWSLVKTHDVAVLTTALVQRGVDVEWFRESARDLTTEYIAGRYPGWTSHCPISPLSRRSLPPPENFCSKSYHHRHEH